MVVTTVLAATRLRVRHLLAALVIRFISLQPTRRHRLDRTPLPLRCQPPLHRRDDPLLHRDPTLGHRHLQPLL
jgi:hypothetical protein